MPYPFAHPAAVLPLSRPMGRLAVPSALAIGSIVPDAWYFVPLVGRADSHSLAALFWFCLPVGLFLYVLYHLVLKQPLIALLSSRLGAFTGLGLPGAPWRAVLISLLAGAATHLAWDGVTHAQGHRWLQHASTLAGTAILGWWCWQKLRNAPARAASLSPFARLWIALGLAGAAAISALWAADSSLALDYAAFRALARSSGIGAVEGLSVALLVYCLLFQRKIPRRAG